MSLVPLQQSLILRTEIRESPNALAEGLKSEVSSSSAEVQGAGKVLQNTESSILASTGIESESRVNSDRSASVGDDMMDRKYFLRGRYGFKLDDELSTVDNTRTDPHHSYEIPKLGLTEGSASNTDATSDTGQMPLCKPP